MPKFRRVEIEQNDDGTFQVSITPVDKKPSGKKTDNMAITYQSPVRYGCEDLSGVMHKIQKYLGGKDKDLSRLMGDDDDDEKNDD